MYTYMPLHVAYCVQYDTRSFFLTLKTIILLHTYVIFFDVIGKVMAKIVPIDQSTNTGYDVMSFDTQ